MTKANNYAAFAVRLQGPVCVKLRLEHLHRDEEVFAENQIKAIEEVEAA